MQYYRCLWTYFTPFSSVSIFDFEQVNVNWVLFHFFSGVLLEIPFPWVANFKTRVYFPNILKVIQTITIPNTSKLFWLIFTEICRSSHRRCSLKKVFLKIPQNGQENTSVRVSSLIKLQGWGLQLFIKETLEHVFPCEFCEIFKNTFLREHLRWLLLDIQGCN